MQSKLIEIRDLRQQDWLWTSKQLLFHEKIDGNNYKVYCGLASYANNDTQQAFPSIDTLSEKLHISRNTVIKSLAILAANGFIKTEKNSGEHNVYILLSIGHTQKSTESVQVKKEKEVENKGENNAPTLLVHSDVQATTQVENRPLFPILWADYPNKANKKTGEKKFEKLNRAQQIVVIKDVRIRKKMHDTWLKGFIPHLSTYINQERWNDPIVKPTGEKVQNKNMPVIHPDIRKRLFKENNDDRFRDTMEGDEKIKSVGDLLKV